MTTNFQTNASPTFRGISRPGAPLALSVRAASPMEANSAFVVSGTLLHGALALEAILAAGETSAIGAAAVAGIAGAMGFAVCVPLAMLAVGSIFSTRSQQAYESTHNVLEFAGSPLALAAMSGAIVSGSSQAKVFEVAETAAAVESLLTVTDALGPRGGSAVRRAGELIDAAPSVYSYVSNKTGFNDHEVGDHGGVDGHDQNSGRNDRAIETDSDADITSVIRLEDILSDPGNSEESKDEPSSSEIDDEKDFGEFQSGEGNGGNDSGDDDSGGDDSGGDDSGGDDL